MEEGLVCLTIFLASRSLAGKISEEKSEKVVGAEGKNIILEQWIEGEISMDTWKTWYSFEGETWHSFEGNAKLIHFPEGRWWDEKKKVYIYTITLLYSTIKIYIYNYI